MSILGISVCKSRVCAVLVRSGRVIAHSQVLLSTTQDLQSVVETSLDAVLSGRQILQPRVVVAVGQSFSHVKRLEGLPTTRQSKLLSRVLRENPAAFFLLRGSRLHTSDVELRSDGSTWASAFDARVVDDIVAALRKRRLTRAIFVPSVIARVASIAEGTYVFEEDTGAIEVIAAREHRLTSVRQTPALREPSAADERLSDIGAVYAPALAAAVAPRPLPMTWSPEPDPRTQRMMDRVRLALAVAAFIVCVSAALAAPGLRAHRIASRASKELERRQQSQREAAELEARLARVSGELERVNRFEANRGRMTKLVGSLAQALPESTALVTLRVDSVEASFTTLAPHVADILPELASVDGVFNPRIAGSVTREAQGNTRLERATVRFRRQTDVVKSTQAIVQGRVK